MVIQRILRHANVSTMATYYIKTAADNVRNAMAKLEKVIPTTSKVVEFGGEGGIRTGAVLKTKASPLESICHFRDCRLLLVGG